MKILQSFCFLLLLTGSICSAGEPGSRIVTLVCKVFSEPGQRTFKSAFSGSDAIELNLRDGTVPGSKLFYTNYIEVSGMQPANMTLSKPASQIKVSEPAEEFPVSQYDVVDDSGNFGLKIKRLPGEKNFNGTFLFESESFKLTCYSRMLQAAIQD